MSIDESRRTMGRGVYSTMSRSRSWSGPDASDMRRHWANHSDSDFYANQSITSSFESLDDMEAVSINDGVESWGMQPGWHGHGFRPRVYNCTNAVDSDIVVRFGGRRFEFYSVKATLSEKSGFFRRAFDGAFPIATADVVDLGDEDNRRHVYAMLRFLHGTPYTTIHARESMGLDFHLDMYMLGEQYDIPSLRRAAAQNFFLEATPLADKACFPIALQKILGPDAPVMADPYLQELTIKMCTEQIETLIANQTFKDMALDGELMDGSVLVAMFFAVGERVRTLSGGDLWLSKEERFVNAQAELIAAEAAMGPTPRSFLARQIRAQRAQNAAARNIVIGMPQPTIHPFPAALTSHPPHIVYLPAVKKKKTGITSL
ncbi:hypothetical protein D6C84_05476 [Aureobasidium pullulans]|uniref:BTB domain-containing protein n=1 Tax=Aureobasidium pullulans TaxID=5580 RepID=A0A4V4L0W2_AURPU|nr:hypothetical protein D6C84_05476 [Aureobasidium pullulans]